MWFIKNANTIYICFILVFFIPVLNTYFPENPVLCASSISDLELLPYLPILNVSKNVRGNYCKTIWNIVKFEVGVLCKVNKKLQFCQNNTGTAWEQPVNI